MNLRVGQIYRSVYGVKYQILAVWDEFIWTKVIYATFIKKEPVTQDVEFYKLLTLEEEKVKK